MRMVKGISRQVIVVPSPDPQLFEQAIFILKDGARDGVSDDAILREARRAIRGGDSPMVRKRRPSGPVWACGGALVTGLLWLLSTLL